MTRFFKDPDGNYPLCVGDIVLYYPDWDKTTDPPEGWTEYFDEVLPELPENQTYQEDGFEVDADGKHWRTFKIVEHDPIIPEPPYENCDSWTWSLEEGWVPPEPCPDEYHIWHPRPEGGWVHINDWRAENGFLSIEEDPTGELSQQL